MKCSFAGGCCAAAHFFAAHGTTAPSRAQDFAWLGGDTEQVAAHRTGQNGSHSRPPLLL